MQTADGIGDATRGHAEETIDAVNGLTARWAWTATHGTAFSAVGVWPLLAFLADGAAGAARAELAEALGLPAEQAAAAARKLLGTMRSMPGLDSALGLWTKRTLELRPEWRSRLPADAHGILGDDTEATQRALDAWAARRTGGLVDRMPVRVTRDTELLLANALALRTDWLSPFHEGTLEPDVGPWRGRTLLGLHRRSVRLDRLGVAHTPSGLVTRLTVPGDTGLDVHLLLGEERMSPGQVLGAGVALLDHTSPTPRTVPGAASRTVPGPVPPIVPGSQLPYGEPGPGLRVGQEPCTSPQPATLNVTTPAYEVRADHDLLALHWLFGLGTALDTTGGHFPGISAFPLAIGAAGQSVVAQFGARGFRAAAVTAVAATYGGAAPRYRHTSTVVRAVFDRPFGFLAVDRETRLVLVAGWVTDPTPRTWGRA